ncbi:DUF998 domain-containing protein [Deinococcus altitudinis]|uniref:DUF998 domain-containing protein n=1 Tax=Deinococcus altitudinis TaxID=468914 RepID=UPI0038922F06
MQGQETRIKLRWINLRRPPSALAGLVAPVLFVTIFMLEGWLRPGYHPASMFVSELSLGPRGWVQIANFVVTGGLVVVFAWGLRTFLFAGRATKGGARCLTIIGVSLIASGPSVTDPSVLFNQHSPHGLLHGLFGAMVFSLAPISCFIFFRRFLPDPIWRRFAWWTLAVGVVLVLTIVALKVSQLSQGALFMSRGLVQQVYLVVFFGWQFSFA